MQNKLTVTIAGQEYTLVAAEDAAYMEKVAAHVDAKVREVLDGARVSSSDAAILAALNMADEYFKGQEAAEALRGQIKGYADEAAQAQSEVSELKREVFRLQQKLERQSR